MAKLPEDIQGVQWLIPHPGTGLLIECDSFQEAMDKWFEGFNLPRLTINGMMEPIEAASLRVTEHFRSTTLEAS